MWWIWFHFQRQRIRKSYVIITPTPSYKQINPAFLLTTFLACLESETAAAPPAGIVKDEEIRQPILLRYKQENKYVTSGHFISNCLSQHIFFIRYGILFNFFSMFFWALVRETLFIQSICIRAFNCFCYRLLQPFRPRKKRLTYFFFKPQRTFYLIHFVIYTISVSIFASTQSITADSDVIFKRFLVLDSNSELVLFITRFYFHECDTSWIKKINNPKTKLFWPVDA